MAFILRRIRSFSYAAKYCLGKDVTVGSLALCSGHRPKFCSRLCHCKALSQQNGPLARLTRANVVLTVGINSRCKKKLYCTPVSSVELQKWYHQAVHRTVFEH